MARIVPNQRGIDQLRSDPGVVREVTRRAEAAAAEARANAPVLTGTYRDSIDVTVDEVDGVPKVRIGSDVEYALVVEARTGNLTRSLDAAGGQ